MGIYLKGMDIYPVRVNREGSEYRARFVDIPGCQAFGSSPFEVEMNARYALDAHSVLLGKQGAVLPHPSIVGDRGEGDSYVVYVMPSVFAEAA